MALRAPRDAQTRNTRRNIARTLSPASPAAASALMSLPAEIDALRQPLLAGLKALGWQDSQSTGKATATSSAEGTAAPASATTTADKPETNTAHLAPAHPALRLPAQAPEQLLAYLALLHKWNKAYNLTAVRDPAEMLTLHLLDCLASIAPIEQHLGHAPHELIDVGSGGGLPGIVYAIAWPMGQQHLVDTVGKKAAFLQQCKLQLKLANLHVHHQRIEQLQWPAKSGSPATENATQAGADPDCDSALNSTGNAAADRAPTNADSPRASTTKAPRIFTCRAFASLHDFVTQTWHLREAGSQWIALKGQWPAQEISELETKTAQLLKSTFTLQSIELHPPGLGDAKRHLICLQSNGTAL